MSMNERFIAKNLEIQELLKKEIYDASVGLSKRSVSELNDILVEVQKMQNGKDFPIAYPRTIVDSWDYQDELGIELLDLFDLFEKILSRRN